MKEIDFEKIRKDAINSNISEFLLLKRQIKYRIVSFPNNRRNCLNCMHSQKVSYNDGIIRNQCEIIGLKKDNHANVDDQHICTSYKFSMIKYK